MLFALSRAKSRALMRPRHAGVFLIVTLPFLVFGCPRESQKPTGGWARGQYGGAFSSHGENPPIDASREVHLETNFAFLFFLKILGFFCAEFFW